MKQKIQSIIERDNIKSIFDGSDYIDCEEFRVLCHQLESDGDIVFTVEDNGDEGQRIEYYSEAIQHSIILDNDCYNCNFKDIDALTSYIEEMDKKARTLESKLSIMVDTYKQTYNL